MRVLLLSVSVAQASPSGAFLSGLEWTGDVFSRWRVQFAYRRWFS